MKEIKCKNCNIKYQIRDRYLDCDADDKCPMCDLASQLLVTRVQLNVLQHKYKILDTCDKCMGTFGLCDRDRGTCEKLK